jgi:hypothetical protein
MVPKEVDIEQHQFIKNTFLPTAQLDFFKQNILNGKDFLDSQIYLPLTCFSVPLK